MSENNIYSSLSFKVETRYKLLKELLNCFYENKEKWLSSEDLESLGFKNNVELRKNITILIEEMNMPIISGYLGYKLTLNEDEILKYIKSLNSRISGIERRVKALEKHLTNIYLFENEIKGVIENG